MKRFLVALAIMIGTVFVFMLDVYSHNKLKSKYNYVPSTTKVYVYNSEYGLIRFSDTEEEIPSYMKAQMDFVFEMDSVKYFLVD